MTLPSLDAEVMGAIARTLRIPQHQGGHTAPWEPTSEQVRAWDAAHAHPWVYITKPRQIGLSTAICLDDVLWTFVADRAGNKVRCGIIVDTDDKAKERLRVCADFAGQMRLPHVATTDTVTFPGGSEIVAMTAGGKAAGRSGTYHRYHLTELPFWERDEETWGAIMPALAGGGRLVLETTMDIRRPLAKKLWQTPNDFHKVFFALEQHEEYRRDPLTLRDDQREWLAGEGFTDESAMAWFVWAVDNKAGGDVVRAFREYPQLERHMFQSAEGRWIGLDTQVRRPVRVVHVEGASGSWPLVIWRELADSSAQLVVGVDTATGKEQDSSALAVIDKRDDGLCATFEDASITIDDLAAVTARAVEEYTLRKPSPGWGVPAPRPVRPELLVEGNGIGAATAQACRRLGLELEEIHTTDASRYEGLLDVKRAIESGRISGGPQRLADECAGLHRDELGRFKGPKDLLMAIGFALRRKRANPYRPEDAPPDTTKAHFMERLKREKRKGSTW